MLEMVSLKKSVGKINIRGRLTVDEPMAAHTTFRVGGPADIFAQPEDVVDLRALLQFSCGEGLSPFILGGGANILVSDRGIRGLVIDMSRFSSISIKRETSVEQETLHVQAGLPVSDAAAWCAEQGYAGLDFLYSMPGSVGGAVWMNARCYDGEVYNVLTHVDLLHHDGTQERYLPHPEDFAYKVSPFQDNRRVIVGCGFRMTPEPRDAVWQRMQHYRADREQKGHFAAPSAGSMFKNNRDFGSPSGVIIDRLGLRGYQIGGARISDRHANIIINTGTATAADIDQLATFVADRVHERFGFTLEREVLRVGQWEE